MKASKRLAELGMQLPAVAAPVGSYVPAKQSGSHVFTSGQLPIRDGSVVYAGAVPDDVSVEDATKGAEMAMLNALSAVSMVTGDIDVIKQVVRVAVFVNSSPGFTAQPTVANGASDLLASVFGNAGKHARAAVGVAELPLDAAVEVELVVEV